MIKASKFPWDTWIERTIALARLIRFWRWCFFTFFFVILPTHSMFLIEMALHQCAFGKTCTMFLQSVVELVSRLSIDRPNTNWIKKNEIIFGHNRFSRIMEMMFCSSQSVDGAFFYFFLFFMFQFTNGRQWHWRLKQRD